MLFEMKTATITEKGQIALPRSIREVEGFEEGDKIVLLAFEDHIEIRPLEQIRKRLDFAKISNALLSEKALAKDWLSKEDEEAWKDL